MRYLRRTALAVMTVLMAAASPGTADTLRVGKAGRDAFSFVPADVGVQTGIFKKHGLLDIGVPAIRQLRDDE